jgi:hypothetical protein
MFREDLQGDVLVDDFGNQIAQLLELINVSSVHEDTVGQRARLIAARLVRLVKKWLNLRVSAEQLLVEMSSQRFTAAFQQWHGRFDDGTIRSIQHD